MSLQKNTLLHRRFYVIVIERACCVLLVSLWLVLPRGALQARPAAESPILAGITIPPLRFQLPQPQTTNALTQQQAELITLHDAELPLVKLSLYFRNGIQDEHIDRAGSLQAILQLLERGGSRNKSGVILHQELSELGASINFFSGRDYWGLRLHSIKHNFAAALALMQELLLEPALPVSHLKDIQNAMLIEIQQRNERPARIGQRRLNEILYPGLRLGYVLQKTNVYAITQQSLMQEWRWRSDPRQMYITAAGDIQNLDLPTKLSVLLAALQQKRAATPHTPNKASVSVTAAKEKDLRQSNAPYHNKIVLITKDAAQAVIRIGAYLPAHNHADFYALQLANYILGGGSFTSRLVQKVRVEKGLAYYSYSYNNFEAQDGAFHAACGTRVEQAAQALRLILQEIQAMQDGVSAQELQLAKEAMLNSIIFQFDSAQKIVQDEVRFRLHQMPPNYLREFPLKIRAVTRQDIQRAARLYWRLKQFYIVVVGPGSLKKELQKIRPVITIEPEEKLF